ncbi:MAG: glycosyltransferase [Desulfovibrio sp.]|nr:glycosyltransferase [Desulfovibrio sp.]
MNRQEYHIMPPFFTIVTATRNAGATLPGLLESLAGQTRRDFELIIQDGASTDDTLALAESYRTRLPCLSLISEPDTGIYDAWNRALARIRGEWVLFLGADDALASPATLQDAAPGLAGLPEHVLYCCGDMAYSSQGMPTGKTVRADMDFHFKKLPCKMTIPHPALFHRSALFSSNAFDAAFRIGGDYDFIAKTWQHREQGRELGMIVTVMSVDGCSHDPKNRALMLHERKKARRRVAAPLRMIPLIFLEDCNDRLWDIKQRLKLFLTGRAWGRRLWNALSTLRKTLLAGNRSS